MGGERMKKLKRVTARAGQKVMIGAILGWNVSTGRREWSKLAYRQRNTGGGLFYLARQKSFMGIDMIMKLIIIQRSQQNKYCLVLGKYDTNDNDDDHDDDHDDDEIEKEEENDYR